VDVDGLDALLLLVLLLGSFGDGAVQVEPDLVAAAFAGDGGGQADQGAAVAVVDDGDRAGDRPDVGAGAGDDVVVVAGDGVADDQVAGGVEERLVPVLVGQVGGGVPTADPGVGHIVLDPGAL